VIPGDGDDGPGEASQEGCRPVVLLGATPVCEVAARDDQFRVDTLDQPLEPGFQTRVVMASEMEVGKVQNSYPLAGHGGGGYTLRGVVDEPTEIFDDLYLGLRAGGALRKKRRGEPLTTDEQEALGRWQRLSKVRKAVTLGAFALGTFGLGFTIGGLIFGKWRRA